MLECELAEQPASRRRTLDIAWSGLVARASRAGLVGAPIDTALQARASLAWVAVSLCAFLAFGLAMWSQLVVGWQWTSPRTLGTTAGTVVMTAGVALLLVGGVLAVLPVAGVAIARMAHGGGRRLAAPSAVVALAAAVLVAGARRFENGWPGTGGHHWALQGLVPGGLAAFVWASTLAVTSYWAHPGALRAFPTLEVAWMAVSPVAIVALGAAAATVLRRLELPARVVRFELRVAQAACVAMSVVVAGAVMWLADGQRRPRSVPSNLFHVGAIDMVGMAVMALAVLLSHQAVHRGLAAMRRRDGAAAA